MNRDETRRAPFRGAAESIIAGSEPSAKPARRRLVKKAKKDEGKMVVYKGAVTRESRVQNEESVFSQRDKPRKVARKRPPVQSSLAELDKFLASPEPKADTLKPETTSPKVLGRRKGRKKKEVQLSLEEPEMLGATMGAGGLQRLLEAKSEANPASGALSAAETATNSHREPEGEFDSTATIRKGDMVLYRERNGSMKKVEVLGVDYALVPPSYVIRINGNERETERQRLFVPKAKTPEYEELEGLLQRMRTRHAPSAGSGNTDTRRMKLEFTVVGARHLPKLDDLTPQRSAATRDTLVGVGHALAIRLRYMDKTVRTTTRWDEPNPDWNERFPFSLGSEQEDDDEVEDEDMEIALLDHVEGKRDTEIGSCVLSGRELQSAPLQEEDDQSARVEPKQVTLVLHDKRGKKLVGADGRTAVVQLAFRRRVLLPGTRSSMLSF